MQPNRMFVMLAIGLLVAVSTASPSAVANNPTPEDCVTSIVIRNVYPDFSENWRYICTSLETSEFVIFTSDVTNGQKIGALGQVFVDLPVIGTQRLVGFGTESPCEAFAQYACSVQTYTPVYQPQNDFNDRCLRSQPVGIYAEDHEDSLIASIPYLYLSSDC